MITKARSSTGGFHFGNINVDHVATSTSLYNINKSFYQALRNETFGGGGCVLPLPKNYRLFTRLFALGRFLMAMQKASRLHFVVGEGLFCDLGYG